MASTFFAFNPDGTEKWNYKFTGGGIVATPAIGSDGTVYAATVPGEAKYIKALGLPILPLKFLLAVEMATSPTEGTPL